VLEYVKCRNWELLKVESEGYQGTVAQLLSNQTKIKIWGCAVFVVPFHLDQILGKEYKEEGALRSCVIGILADLTLTVGKSSRVQDKSIRIHAEQDLVGLLEELSDAENKNLEKVLWESKIVLSVHYELFDEARDIPTNFYESLSKADLITEYAEKIKGWVDCLYQTLSTLRRVKEIRYLQVESKASEIIATLESVEGVFEPCEASQAGSPAESEAQNNHTATNPITKVVETTTEMILAIQLSIKEAEEERERDEKDSQHLQDALKQIEEWNKEIERLKARSITFSKLTESNGPTGDIEANIKMIQCLATMARDIGKNPYDFCAQALTLSSERPPKEGRLPCPHATAPDRGFGYAP
jgi:hypothetical protein